MIVLLATAPAALADWTAHADFTSCPRKYFPNPTTQEGPFATESACQARVAEARRGNNASCARYSCKEGAAGSGTSSSEPGHQLDGVIERAISAGASGEISGGDAAGLVAAGVIANALMAGSSPEQKRQAEARRQLRQQQEAEQERQRAAAEEARKDRLLAEMKEMEQTGDLQLMTDDGDLQLMTDDGDPPVQAGSDAGGGSELALMTDDDDARGIMGKRKAPAPKRNQPPATRVSTGPYTPGAKPPKVNEVPLANGGQQVAIVDRPEVPLQPPAPGPDPFNRGIADGRACTQRNPAFCGNLRGGAFEQCGRRYDDGFNWGAREHEQDLVRRGTAAGQRDRAADPTNNVALSHPEARGSCGNIFIQAYNNAFR